VIRNNNTLYIITILDLKSYTLFSHFGIKTHM